MARNGNLGSSRIRFLVACLVLQTVARADDYPTRPITLIVPFPPGGSTTVMARNVADKLSAALGQQIVVENRGGAGGTLGTRFVARATPDGYTILLSYTATMAIAPAMNANAGYDPRKDFAPIGMIGSAPSVLVVHPSLPVHSVAELIAYAKAAPAPVQYGSPGVGTVNHLAGRISCELKPGMKLQHVPYKGNGPAMGDLLGGHIPMMFLPIPVALGNIKAGTLRGLAIASAKRSSLLPDLADARRKRRARFRGGAALRAGGARRHAAGGHCAAQQGTQRRACDRGRARIVLQPKAPSRCRGHRRPMPRISTGKKRSGAGW